MDATKLTARQRKVYDTLCSGKVSAADISRKTGFCDPRGYIRDLRNKGVRILDDWRISPDKTRYKVYYIERV